MDWEESVSNILDVVLSTSEKGATTGRRNYRHNIDCPYFDEPSCASLCGATEDNPCWCHEAPLTTWRNERYSYPSCMCGIFPRGD